MPTPRTKVFGVKDARVRKMLTDVEGAAPTYGDWIDVPGIKTVTIGGTVSTAELRGDNKRLDFDASLGGVSLTFEYAKMDLNALSVFLGGTTTSAVGSTAFALEGDDRFSYFQFEAVSVSADPIDGDVLIRLNKNILSEFPEVGMAEEDYRTFSVSAEAMDPNGTASWLDIEVRDAGGLLTA